MIYSDADIRRSVGRNAFAAGDAYQRQGRVLAFEAARDETIRTRVQGQHQRPYEQTITLSRSAAGLVRVVGRCSCPMSVNCKHVAAALLEGLRRSRAAPPTPEARAARLIPAATGRGAAEGSRLAPGLPSDLALWLDELGRAQVTASEDYPAQITQRLVYVLSPVVRPRHMARLGVDPISTRLLRDGRLSESGRSYQLEGAVSSASAKFLRPSDRRILSALAWLRRDHYSATPLLAREAAGPILADILATGRARWLTVNGPVLAPGEPRPGRITWQSHDQTTVQPVVEAGGSLVVFNATPPVYVDPIAGLVGPLDTGLAPRMAAALLEAPPVPGHLIAEINTTLLRRVPDIAELRLPQPQAKRVIDESPKPCLHLLAADLPAVATIPAARRGFYDHEPVTEHVALARVSFAYGPLSVRLGDKAPRVTRLQGSELIEVRRDLEAERRHLATLLSLGLVPATEHRHGTPKPFADDLLLEGDDIDWLDILYHDLPDLVAQGWQLDIAEDFPFRMLRGDGAIAAELREGSGIDWFELGLGVLIDGDRIDLVDPIVSLLQSPGFDPAAFRSADSEVEPFYLALADGRVLAMPIARLLPIVEAIAALAMGGLDDHGRLRLGAADAVGLAQFEAAAVGLVWQGGERLRDMGRKLGTAGGIPPVTLPATFRAALRPYQAAGAAWLAFLREVGLGGVLADDMGLGKTVQASPSSPSRRRRGGSTGPPSSSHRPA